jgi:SSS family solute:Na+ symporter/sodium/proline symporter
LYQALGTKSVLAKTLYAYTIYAAALTPVILAAFYSKRVNAYGAVSAIAAGTFVTVFWDDVLKHRMPSILADRDAIFPALMAAVVCLIVVSLLTPAPSQEKLKPFL